MSFSRRLRVSAVGFQPDEPSFLRLLGWSPAARASPARLTSPVATMASSRSMRVELMRGLYHISVWRKGGTAMILLCANGDHPLNVPREHVDFNIKLSSNSDSTQRRFLRGVRNDVDREPGRLARIVYRVHGERD